MLQAGTHHTEINDDHFNEMFPNAGPVHFLKDTVKFTGALIHESELNNGFCYRRWSMDLKAIEYLAYTGYFGAWTDDTRYFERRMIDNTVFHRQAQVLKSVSWFHIHTKIDRVKINR